MPDINPPAAAVAVPVVFSRRDQQQFSPPGSPNVYTIAPLTFRERQAMRTEMAREGCQYPAQPQVMAALRAAVREIAPDNIAEHLAVIDALETTPEDADVRARALALEMAVADVPVYANLVAARTRYLGMVPWFTARYALRGWAGQDLPPFRRDRGAVPDELLDALPPDDLEAVGWRASQLTEPNAAAVGNSEAPSPSPDSLTPSPAG